ncbi:hypothetical protein G6O69_26710 [Pseudenhygromyxa sp. WMMC2535]|uniref:hypothetical protein n=1 Tax=Pseudenhygromyxa sp. WMMC2535 TaxID=2712867 RepID=UPI0015532AB4|nr:hypothetical protein [Pseudenhygromyxa sp. WMMC2535]NVB41458.1 hypothetical protein [Pseudenhygromyxa sp. WMMC2535]
MSTTTKILPDRTADAENLVRLLQSVSDADKIVKFVQTAEGTKWEAGLEHLRSKRNALHEKVVTFVENCVREMVESDDYTYGAKVAHNVAPTLVAKLWPNGPTVPPPNPAALADWLRTFASASGLRSI